ncbi:hypothetical protein [Streptosporangium sp. H16]|uniref:hypothetical protein n=1 Tax=Streptosporangium sp. H16 TaxID=3444184 RepID=UPI003F797E7C
MPRWGRSPGNWPKRRGDIRIGWREFHSGADEQGLSLDFLHRYLMGNYRDLYAATLALDVNDHNAVAEGFAAKHRIARATFLERIAPQLTRLERLRL